MPQLWLTYAELADALDTDAVQARETVVRAAWTRKHSSDGLTRVLLPRDAMLRYFASAATQRPAPLRQDRSSGFLARTG